MFLFGGTFNASDEYVYGCTHTPICKDMWMYIILHICICVHLGAWLLYLSVYRHMHSNTYVQTLVGIIIHTHSFILYIYLCISYVCKHHIYISYVV